MDPGAYKSYDAGFVQHSLKCKLELCSAELSEFGHDASIRYVDDHIKVLYVIRCISNLLRI